MKNNPLQAPIESNWLFFLEAVDMDKKSCLLHWQKPELDNGHFSILYNTLQS